jgi:nickel superoxide dismutase
MDVKKLARRLIPGTDSLPVAEAHCDGPCGVYDPASARIAAEAVRSMTKKLLDMHAPDPGDAQAVASFQNTAARYVAIKEEQAELAKKELLVLWTDYFKPQHLEATPNLHELFWNAAKLCSTAKQNVDTDACDQLISTIEEIHNVFWASKGRDDVAFYLAG